jgi:metal-responsive CopG/Arc/MetJ family transcriptional regulator
MFNKFGASNMSNARTSARIPSELRKRLDGAINKSGQSESKIVRLALEHFLKKHRSASAIIAAVLNSHRAKLEDET